jgi:hypothetical protein
MVAWLSLSSGLKPDRCLQSNGLLTTLSQHYYLFLGTLSAHPHGVKLLEKCGLFQRSVWTIARLKIVSVNLNRRKTLIGLNNSSSIFIGQMSQAVGY